MTIRHRDGSIGSGGFGDMGDDVLDDSGIVSGSGTGLSGSVNGDFADGMIGISSGEPASRTDLDQGLPGSGTGLSGSGSGDFADGVAGTDRLDAPVS